jgi:hypothetical protein
MAVSPGLAKYQERQRNLRRMKELKSQLRKFEGAFQEEGNNEKMDNFCWQGIKKLRAEISYLTTII